MSDYRSKLLDLGITATRDGKYFCPRCHQERTNKSDKSLSIKFEYDRVLYKCHHCGWTGVVFMEERSNFIPKKTYRKPEPPSERDTKENLYKYFEKRHIPKDVVDYYGVGINDKKEMIFKYTRDGELVNIKYRTNLGNGKKSFRQEKDTESILFGMDQVTQREYIILTEGEIDVLSWMAVGLEAVSVPNGACEKNLTWLENCYDWLKNFETYYICGDNDEAGQKMVENLSNRLDKTRIKLIRFNQPKDDVNTVLCRDKDELIDIFSNARYLDIPGITCFSANEDSILDYFNNGYKNGASTGWWNLDQLFTIKKGYLMIVTGYPSRGKSYFTDNLLFNLSKKDGWKHLVCSFENTLENHFARFASFFLGKKFNKFEMNEDEVKKAIRFFNDKIYRIELDRMWDIDNLIEQLEYAVRRFGVDTFTIDPYNRLDRPNTDREDKYIGEMLAKLTMAAKRLNVLIIFVAHPKKPQEKGKAPTMYDISGSADWYNMADYGIIIHRERKDDGSLENNLRVIVEKVKDFQLGNPAGVEVHLIFNRNNYRLEEND